MAGNIATAKSPTYCFVILTTSDFTKRAAYLANTDGTNHQAFKLDIIGEINRADCKNLRDEICQEDSPLPRRLVEMVSALNIE